MPLTDVPFLETFFPDRTVGWHVLACHEVGSTMDVAWGLEAGGAAHGTIVRTDVQRTGRGRLGRRWESGPNDSVLASVILRAPPLEAGAPLSIAASLAVFDCLAGVLEQRPMLKWPNDVLVDGKKIAGILVEWRVSTDGSGTAVVGIGLNVNLDPSHYFGIGETAISVREVLGTEADVEWVADRLWVALDRWVDRLVTDRPRALTEWRGALSTVGANVIVHTRGGPIAGLAVDVNELGHLEIRDGQGRVHTVAEGDVTLRE